MDLQVIIVAIIIAGALFYLGKTVFKNSQGHSCESGKCSQHKPIAKK
ncbi:MAG: FeoB-associated Cys-rich membrane protein [Bacteroidia bacterium]|nr:FeoB-associated Cys-rich membrane protein [Bacteroidia bacterium]MBP9688090.1 FeoB-associated Cys-rich membrane protein [Bacteroidia bacterium]